MFSVDLDMEFHGSQSVALVHAPAAPAIPDRNTECSSSLESGYLTD